MDCNDGSLKGFVGYKYPTYACYTLVLKFMLSAGRVCGAATHVVGKNANDSLLLVFIRCIY